MSPPFILLPSSIVHPWEPLQTLSCLGTGSPGHIKCYFICLLACPPSQERMEFLGTGAVASALEWPRACTGPALGGGKNLYIRLTKLELQLLELFSL
jgi:hypothetical protein